MNKFLNGLKENTNFTYTENGAIARVSTLDAVQDMFAFGGAYRNRTDEDCIVLFKTAFEQDPLLALKCLFYVRDAREGQGERRFFRVCMNWFAHEHPDIVIKNLEQISFFGRWDDLYTFVNTPVETAAFELIKYQLALDVQCETPSLLAKWLKSENTSSAESRQLAFRTREYLGMNHKQYRKTLSVLRSRINVLEKLMSQNRWDEIQFDKIPSRAGFIYRNAFARRDILKERYRAFAEDKDAKVNAKVLYPYECVEKALREVNNDTERLMINKYWDNLADYIQNAEFNGMAIVDTSGSMYGTPIYVAISLGMYCAEKAQGPFHNHFMTFSNYPQMVEIEGVDFCDKVQRMFRADWGGSTNIESAFNMLLNTAIENHCSQDEIPQNLIIVTDMEFNSCACLSRVGYDRYGRIATTHDTPNETLFETMEKRWASHGYKMPNLVFWNVDARQNNIPMKQNGHVSYVSGFSPVLYEQIMKGKTAVDLMLDKLNSDRYNCIKV